MVAQIAHCDPSHAARWLEQAEGDIKTAGLLALGVDRIDAETILKNCDGNLRRVFAKLARIVTGIKGGRRASKASG